MELRKRKLVEELRAARESLLDINFYESDRPWLPVTEWLHSWDTTFRKCNTLGRGLVNIANTIATELDGYQHEADAEIFDELRPKFVGYIDWAISIIHEQDHEVKPVLEDYIKRIKDTKLAEMLKEFNISKDTSPNLVAIGFRTILALAVQEKAKRMKPQSNTASRTDLSVDRMLDSARTDGILTSDEWRLIESFKATHKDIYDFVGHRPSVLVNKDEVDTMVDLLNKLLPSIIN